MATIGKLMVQIGADVGGLTQGLKTAQGQLRSFGSQLRGVGTGITLGMSAPLMGLAAVALNSAADFEQSMALMQATTGATGSQMAALEAQALDLGATTAFSAGEAAGAMLELAKAGMTAEEVSAAIPGVMDMAAASGIGLADAATITSNALNSFGLEASKSSEVANTFAAAANASSADVGTLAAGFQMAGAVFAANNQSVTTLATSLAILANNGIAGSDAGTSLKTMMMRLAAPTAEASAAMDRLGLDVYDASGAMIPFGDIVAQLETATAGLSDSQRNAALQTIFGADAIRAATILAGEGSAKYLEMEAAVGKQGAASEMAAARMSGLRGAIEYFKGSIDSLLIGSATPFLDTLSGMVKQAADLVTGLGNLSPETQRFAAILLAVVAAAGPALMILGTMATALAGLLSPVGLIIGVVAALGVAFATNFMGMRDAVMGAWGVIQPYLMMAYTWFMAQLPGALAALQAWFVTAWTAVSAAVSAAWAVVGPLLTQLWTWVQATLPGAMAGLQTGFTTAWTAVSTAVSAAWGIVQPLLAEMANWFSALLPDSIGTLQTSLTTLWSMLSMLFGPAVDRVREAFGTLGESLGALGPSLTGLGTAFGTLWTTVQPLIVGLGQVIAAVLGVAAVASVNGFAAVITALGPIVQTVVDTITAALTWLSTTIGGIVALVTAVINGDWAGAWTAAGDIVSGTTTFIGELFNSLLTVATTIFSALYTMVTDTLTDLGVDAQGTVETIKGWWETKWTAIKDFLQPVIDMIGNVKSAIQGFADWIGGLSIPNPFAGILSTIDALRQQLPGWMPGSTQGSSGVNTDGGFGAPGYASGTAYAPGGLAWVGERGPELVRLPKGTRIWSNDASMAMAGAGAGATVNMGPVYVNDRLDVEALAYRAATIAMRKMQVRG